MKPVSGIRKASSAAVCLRGHTKRRRDPPSQLGPHVRRRASVTMRDADSREGGAEEGHTQPRPAELHDPPRSTTPPTRRNLRWPGGGVGGKLGTRRAARENVSRRDLVTRAHPNSIHHLARSNARQNPGKPVPDAAAAAAATATATAAAAAAAAAAALTEERREPEKNSQPRLRITQNFSDGVYAQVFGYIRRPAEKYFVLVVQCAGQGRRR